MKQLASRPLRGEARVKPHPCLPLGRARVGIPFAPKWLAGWTGWGDLRPRTLMLHLG